MSENTESSLEYGPDNPWHGLARRVCAAVMSNQLGIGIDYALRKHVPEKLGPLWYQAAEYLARTSMDATVAHFVPEILPEED